MKKTVRSIAVAVSAALLSGGVASAHANAPVKEPNPISSMTWILAYQNQPDRVRGAKLVNFLRWAGKDGERTAAALDYVPLPAAMVAQLQNRLKTIGIADTRVGDAR